ncbi:MAG: malate dehydrogenase [Nitrospiraceae bacterium]|nr:malate dehydrogenase [Nitrospiraceae bacterium]
MKPKVTVIGAGNVGATTALMLSQAGIADVVLYDIAEGVPQGKALDITEATPLSGRSVSCRGTNSYDLTAGSDIIVITAGFPRKPGMSRDDLLHANTRVIREVVTCTAGLSPECIYIVVTNPMDVMTHIAWEACGFDYRRVLGMGGILDSARFRTFISMELGVSPADVNGMVLGGHGDLMVPLPNFTTVNGIPIAKLLSASRTSALIERTRNGGAEIVSLLKTGSAYYAPAASTVQMARAILLDEKRILPCAAYLTGEYGIQGVFVGVPVLLGRGGAEKILELPLTQDETTAFAASVEAVRAMLDTIQR